MKLHKIVQRLKYILNKVFMSVCACGCIFLNLSEMKITSHQKQVCITSGLCSGRSLLLLSTNDQENISAAFQAGGFSQRSSFFRQLIFFFIYILLSRGYAVSCCEITALHWMIFLELPDVFRIFHLKEKMSILAVS